MSLISEFGDVLHMSSLRRTSDVLFSHTWRNACSWATQVVTRAGSSTTQQHKSLSSQNVQNSMNTSFLDLRKTRQHRPLISCLLVHRLWPLCRLLCPCLIWRGIVMLRSLHLAFLMLSCHSMQRCLNALLHHQHRQPLSTHLSLLLHTICHQIFAARHAFRVRQDRKSVV